MPIFLPFFSGVLGLLFIVLAHVTLSLGVIQTATIDDNQSGVVYSPSNRFTLNSNCAACVVHPDANQAVDGTWHDSSQFRGQGPVSVTLSFTGTGIDVFCILANTLPNTVTTTYLAFTLDGSSYPSFTHNPDSSNSDYLYKQNVFSISRLAQVPHTLVISTNPPSDSFGSLLLFDSAKYTFDDGTTPPPPPTTPPITTTTAQVTNVVTTTAITQITTTDAQKALSTETITGAIITVGGSTFTQSLPSSASAQSAGTAVFASSSKSSMLGISTPPSGSPIPSPSSSSSSSSTPSTVSLSTKFNYGAVLAGILIPIVLIALAGTIFYRRRRAQRGIRDSESQGVQSTAPMIGSQRSQTNSGYNWEGSAPSMTSALGSRRITLNPADNFESESSRSDLHPTSEDEGSSAMGGQSPTQDRSSSGARTYHSSSSQPPHQYSLSRSPSLFTTYTSPPPGYEPRQLPSIPS
ncbi:hypothetical protein DFH09DRAFT_1025175 [Mycena vulgaris]|nr:hypothetical protein DFH09DRAFT_1025175 [Mycena vulgaris]